MATLRMDYRRKSQWDYVLEEMRWLANDFAQVYLLICYLDVSLCVFCFLLLVLQEDLVLRKLLS